MPNSNENTFSFIPVLFSYYSWIAASDGRSLTTPEHQHLRPILSVTPPLPSVKTIKKPEVDKKIKACERHLH